MANLPSSDAFLDVGRITAALGLAPGMHVADLGCGSGYFTIALGQAVGNNGVSTGVDVRLEPLEELRVKAEAAGLGNVKEVRADLEVIGGTGIPDNSQDVALLANTLFQSTKKDAMIQEAARMTKSGGKVVIIEWKKGTGGFGPPEDLRTSEEEMKSLATAQGLRFDRTMDAGQLYYGMILIKP